MQKGLETYDVTRAQLEEWDVYNPDAFFLSLATTTPLLLVSAYRSHHGWVIEAESDRNAFENAFWGEAMITDDLTDGYYEPLGYEVWRVVDMPVEGTQYAVDADTLVRLEGISHSIEELVCESSGIWNLKRLKRAALTASTSGLNACEREMLLQAMTLRDIVGGIAAGRNM